MKYEKNTIRIGKFQKDFNFNIRKVFKSKGYFVILLEIPFNIQCVDNIYGINEKTLDIWQVAENLKWTDLPYENMSMIDNGDIFATDFYGRGVLIDSQTGKILDYRITK